MLPSVFLLILLINLLLDLFLHYYFLSLLHNHLLFRLYHGLMSLTEPLRSRCQLLFLLLLDDLLVLLLSVFRRVSLLALPHLPLEGVLGVGFAGERVLGVAPVISHDDETPAVKHDGFHARVVGAFCRQKAVLRGGVAWEERGGLEFV
jgi:hypothetical protein